MEFQGDSAKGKVKLMHRVVFAILILESALLSWPQPVVAGVTEIEAMRAYVEANGLDGFREASLAGEWVAPVIPSRWHLENKAQPGDSQLISAARSLGASLVSGVDAWVVGMQTETGEGLRDRAARLVDLAVWVLAAEGYGNLILAEHACDVALTGLGRLVVDLTFPVGPVEAMVAQCKLRIHAPGPRGRILNYEVGAAVFPEDATTEQLSRVEMARRARAQSVLTGLTPGQEASELIRGIREMIVGEGLDPDEPEPHAEFFKDESCEPRTTALCWGAKEHLRIVRVTDGPRWEYLEDLILFRKTIGSFPNEPTIAIGVFSPVDDAFREVWLPHRAQHGDVYVGAAFVYQAVLAGRFVDADTRARISAGLATPVVIEPTPGPQVTPEL